MAFSDEGTNTLRQTLGVAEDADEATILAALSEALDERADETSQTDKPQLPEGVVAIDKATLDQLRADAEQGREARAEQLRFVRDQAIEAAIQAGKTTPARREHWAKAWDADPDGVKATLDALEPGLVPVQAAGHDQITEDTEDDAIYAALFGAESKGA